MDRTPARARGGRRAADPDPGMIDPGLDGKVALVTGANTGIGAAIARALGSQGVGVALHYLGDARLDEVAGIRFEHERPGREAAERLAEEIERGGSRVTLVEGDLADPATPARVFRDAEALGPVDILVNNAAHCESPDSVLEASARGLDRHLAVNTRAPVQLMGEFATRHVERGERGGHGDYGGRIVNLSTDSARAFAGQVGYGASKAALEASTRAAAIELGPYGITVNSVAPGPVQTGWITPELEERVRPTIPLRRVGTPEEIADVVVFLSSRQARWITGQVIQVAGGHAL